MIGGMYRDAGVFALSSRVYESRCGRVSVEREGPERFTLYGVGTSPVKSYTTPAEAIAAARVLEAIAEPVRRSRQ